MMDVAVVLVSMSLSVIFMVVMYIRGYRAGANKVLKEWKEWINDIEKMEMSDDE